MPTILDEEYFTVAEAAESIKVSPSTIWRWIDRGEIKAYRLGHRRVLLKKVDISSLLGPARGEGKGEAMSRKENHSLVPLSSAEQRRILGAIEEAKNLQVKLLQKHGGKPFPSAVDILDELRQHRSQAVQ